MKKGLARLLATAALGLFIYGTGAEARDEVRKQPNPRIELSGEKARHYLEETAEGQSLLQAVIASQFGLEARKQSPFDEQSGPGHLGMSHDQNLNAWFAEDGVTIRPTRSQSEQDRAWSVLIEPKAYGYGKQLNEVPPVVSQKVDGNRIEYQRSHDKSAVEAAVSAALLSDLQATRLPLQREASLQLVEWYVNRPEGIEQGFTLNEPPLRQNYVLSEELRVVMAVRGDLLVQVNEGGQAVELLGNDGERTLSYSKLVAFDAEGKRLAARMEAGGGGREIALVVDDRHAAYPIVIDPIIASSEQVLDGGGVRQVDARFGFAVAIDGDNAVVGSWRFDGPANVDCGLVTKFTRTGQSPPTWSDQGRTSSLETNGACGWSVAISGSRYVFGCPGANAQGGRAFLGFFGSAGSLTEIPGFAGAPGADDQFGYSVAISGNKIAVGAPYYDESGTQNKGAAYLFEVNASGNAVYRGFLSGDNSPANQLLGSSVGVDGDIVITGAPGAGAGYAVLHKLEPSGINRFQAFLVPSDGEAGDNFGNSVDISGNTAVVGAFGDDDKGTDAGAAYVFVRGANGAWSQQQKLKASGSRPGDHFSEHAVAIEGNAIVVGATAWDFIGDDNAGAAYVFTRNNTVWTQQTELNGASAYNFGIAVDLSGDTILIGARGADAGDKARAGAAYVYRLDCVPPFDSGALISLGVAAAFTQNHTVCPGAKVTFEASYRGTVTSYQWRKTGANIADATSFKYIVDAARASDAGSYDLFVSNSCGGEFSTPATLTVRTFSLDPTSQNFSVSGSNGIVNVTSSGSCPWTATSNASWITVNSGASGTGNGTVGFTIAANPDPGQRTGTITIAGLAFTVTQDGTNCGYSLAPTSQTLDANASTRTVAVTTNAGCAWTAVSNDPFISVNSGASGTGNGTVTYTVAANFNPAQRTGTITIAGQTFTVTQRAASTLANVSTRLPVGTDDNVLIEGFIVLGPTGSTKKIIVRALGPFLTQFGVTDALPNPTLEIRDGTNTVVARNNDWRNTQVGGIITADQAPEIEGSNLAPTNDLESAIIANLAPGSYTAVVSGVNNTVGTGIVDAFDLSPASPARLANVATRGLIQPGDQLMIAGFITQHGDVRAVIRAIGPSLSAFGINNVLPDTTLQLRDVNGVIVIENDDWQTDPQQKQELENTGLQPGSALEAAVVATIPPGQYTVQVRGKPETTGIGVVEVYFLQ